ncbi:MAG: LysM peptidoglycan-binding domain-containing protein [Anaerolineae bacterium]|nr:LysM peptidoglycan-binding domain-containing protein [Anaerolineae bacterium]
MIRLLSRSVPLFTLLIALWGSAGSRLALAQDGSQPPPVGGMAIHVVQRDETLFGIAMQYGTTVEAIAAANGISDPRYINVGQRLLIPNARLDVPGAPLTHRVAPGDTLRTLAATYQTTADRIAAANHITNPARLFIGQELTINQGAAAETGTAAPPRGLYRAQPGDNMLRIALRLGVPWRALATANGLASCGPLFAGQAVWLSDGDGSLRELPGPLAAFTITPTPAVQGQTIALHITTEGPATLAGTFVGYPIQFVTHDGNQHVALFGVHPFTAAGVYPLALSMTAPDGVQTHLTFSVRVDDGNYSTEMISLDTQQQDLLTTQVTEPEWDLVARTMSVFTAQRYFDGLMGLPSTGAITSQFGTRRAYNGGVLSTFHSGTDLGGAPGSPVLAPAAGVVVLAEPLPVRGNATIIDHGWGVVTGYWHQSEIGVRVGDVVSAGQVIGAVGSTGRSTGPHLHWEMWVGGVQVDPMQWVQQAFP